MQQRGGSVQPGKPRKRVNRSVPKPGAETWWLLCDLCPWKHLGGWIRSSFLSHLSLRSKLRFLGSQAKHITFRTSLPNALPSGCWDSCEKPPVCKSCLALVLLVASARRRGRCESFRADDSTTERRLSVDWANDWPCDWSASHTGLARTNQTETGLAPNTGAVWVVRLCSVSTTHDGRTLPAWTYIW